MSVRRADLKDVESVLSVINASVRDAYGSIIPPEQFKDPVLTLEQLVKEFRSMTFYTYKLEDKLIGVAALRIAGHETGMVRWVHVLPQYRQKGVGTSLMKHIEREAKKMRLKKLEAVYVWEKAWWARNFYTKLGYRKGSMFTLPWGDRAYIYEKTLS
ncbi:MAG: GNAT family N-acetyltransferase [Candidatus Bathyarchaeia archaeon]